MKCLRNEPQRSSFYTREVVLNMTHQSLADQLTPSELMSYPKCHWMTYTKVGIHIGPNHTSTKGRMNHLRMNHITTCPLILTQMSLSTVSNKLSTSESVRLKRPHPPRSNLMASMAFFKLLRTDIWASSFVSP